jgi:hypothetical protein
MKNLSAVILQMSILVMVYCTYPCVKTLHAFAKKGDSYAKLGGRAFARSSIYHQWQKSDHDYSENALLVLLHDTVSSFANFSVATSMCAKPSYIVKKEFQLLRSAALIQGSLAASSFPSLVYVVLSNGMLIYDAVA